VGVRLLRVSSQRTALERGRGALVGLAVGDAVGETFFGPTARVMARIEARILPSRECRWTDDTAMATALVATLEEAGGDVDQDRLMAAFAASFDRSRGYGEFVTDLLTEVGAGRAWRPLVAGAFGGQGSWGNGGAMRVAPLGAWHADDPERAADLARRQAHVTHGHPDAAEGAVAVALAAALLAGAPQAPTRAVLLTDVAAHCRSGLVRDGVLAAAQLGDLPSAEAARLLGSGDQLSAADTVPFALWAASGHPDDFEETFWTTVAGLGDRDTTCAMACGIVAARTGTAGIPDYWLTLVEPLRTVRF
jgi:ADP-ribosylglycohydrolase